MSGTPPSPNDKNSTENIQNNISNVKERIISSSKLFKVLTRSKKDIESKTDENSELQAKITILEKDVISKDLRLSILEKNNFELQTKLLSLQEEYRLKGNTSMSNSQDTETISMLQDKIQLLENKNSNTEKALTSNKMYTQQLEAECESLKQEKAEVGSSKLRQELTKKTQEIKTLNSQVKELKNQVEELNTKVEEVETENERLDIENMALKMDAEEKETESNLPVKIEELQALLNNANENISRLESKLETETRRFANTHTEELKVTTSLKSKVKSLKEEKVELTDKIRELQEEKHELKIRLESSKSTNKTSSSSEQLSGMSPRFVNKIKKFKANYNLLKIENKFLKQQIQKQDIQLSKQQNLEELLQSSSDEDSEDLDVDVIPTSARRMVSESVTPPPVRHSKTKGFSRAPSPTIESSRQGSLLSPTRKISFTEQIPTPMYRRTSSSSSSTSSATKSGLKQKHISIEPIAMDLDLLISEPIASIAPNERISAPLAIAVSGLRKEKSITVNKPESSDPAASSSKLKAAFRTAGLEVPAPKLTTPVSTTIGKPKKATNKLQKFVNSRNPSKVIDSRPLISHSTASSKRALSPEKPSSTVRSESSVVRGEPSAESFTTSVTSDLLPVEEHIIKKTKLDTTYADKIKGWIQNKHLFTLEEFSKEDVRKCLTEIIENYSSMKSPSDPDSKENIPFGIDGKFTIELPNKVDSREKAYAWALSVLAKDNANYFQVIYKTLNRGLKAALTSKRPDTSCARYARLICTICKSVGSLEVIRIVCYDIIRHSTCNKNSIICLYNIASGWKESLVMTNDRCMMLSSLQVCCNAIATDKRTPSNVKQMYEKMKKLCNWPVSIDMGSLDDEVQAVYDEFLTLGKIADSALSEIQMTALKGAYKLSVYDAGRITEVKNSAKIILN